MLIFLFNFCYRLTQHNIYLYYQPSFVSCTSQYFQTYYVYHVLVPLCCTLQISTVFRNTWMNNIISGLFFNICPRFGEFLNYFDILCKFTLDYLLFYCVFYQEVNYGGSIKDPLGDLLKIPQKVIFQGIYVHRSPRGYTYTDPLISPISAPKKNNVRDSSKP